MIAVILFALVLAGLVLLAVALFGKNPTVARGESAARSANGPPQERFSPERFQALVLELLEAMGLSPEQPLSPDGSSRRFVAVQCGPFRDVRHVVFVESAPAGDIVDQTAVLELAEQVKAEQAATGILVSPYTIERGGTGGLEVSVDLIDGQRLRDLVAKELPHWLPELSRYRVTGAPRPAPSALPPAHTLRGAQRTPLRSPRTFPTR